MQSAGRDAAEMHRFFGAKNAVQDDNIILAGSARTNARSYAALVPGAARFHATHWKFA